MEGTIDKLINEIEYENGEYVREIEIEKQQIEALEKRMQDLEADVKVQHELTPELDLHIKTYHRQFTQNRQTIESLTHTSEVLTQQEEALAQKLDLLKKTGEEEDAELQGVLEHYQAVWTDYESVYDSFPQAQELRERQLDMQQAELQVKQSDSEVEQLRSKIDEIQIGGKGEVFTDLNSFIIKLAEYKVKSLNHARQRADNVTQLEAMGKQLEAEKKRQQEAAEKQKQMREEQEAAERRHLDDMRRRALEQQEAARKKAIQQHQAMQDASNQQQNNAVPPGQARSTAPAPAPVPSSPMIASGFTTSPLLMPLTASVASPVPRLRLPTGAPGLTTATSMVAMPRPLTQPSARPPQLLMPGQASASVSQPGVRPPASRYLQVPLLQVQQSPYRSQTRVMGPPPSPLVPTPRPPPSGPWMATLPAHKPGEGQQRTPVTVSVPSQLQHITQGKPITMITMETRAVTPARPKPPSPDTGKSPKTPTMSSPEAAEDSMSPFDLQKHQEKMKMLAASSPGSGFTFSSRQMFEDVQDTQGGTQKSNEPMGFLQSFFGGGDGTGTNSTQKPPESGSQFAAAVSSSGSSIETLGATSTSNQHNIPTFTLSGPTQEEPQSESQGFTFDLGGAGDATISTAGPSGGSIFGMFGDGGDANDGNDGNRSPTKEFSFSFGGSADTTPAGGSDTFSLF